MLAWVRCFVRGRHEPLRAPLGGFRCVLCRTAGADLEEMGFPNEGYLPPMRRLYSRDHGQVTRTSLWETGGHR